MQWEQNECQAMGKLFIYIHKKYFIKIDNRRREHCKTFVTIKFSPEQCKEISERRKKKKHEWRIHDTDNKYYKWRKAQQQHVTMKTKSGEKEMILQSCHINRQKNSPKKEHQKLEHVE